MRKIKFRGRDVETGKLVYGYLVVYEGGKYTHWLQTPGDEDNCPVAPESIAQLVYIDDAGKEYYEGDELIKDGQRWKCNLVMKWERI